MIAEALAQPITDLMAQAGTGILPVGGTADALRAGAGAVGSAVASQIPSAGSVTAGWAGADADACACTAAHAERAGGEIAEQGEGIARVVEEAAGSVRQGVAELGGILDSFLSVVACEGPALATPVGQVAVVAAAIDHIEQAVAVVGRLRGELEVHAGEMARFLPQVQLPPVPDASMIGDVAASFGDSGLVDQARSGVADAWVGFRDQVDGLFGVGEDCAADAGDAETSSTEPCSEGPDGPGSEAATEPGAGDSGGTGVGQEDATVEDGSSTADGDGAGAGADGVGAADADCESAVTLPDGTTVAAPNEQAADAVRAALTQRGVPYSWGGEVPGQAMDCSGLTQWAYGQAGVDLPRLAQDQAVGIQVPMNELQAGDLAVWDGHVAMALGDGTMIEAGSPVEISPVRTTNGGMAFQGFFRPTAV